MKKELVLESIKVENLMTSEEIQECKNFLKTKTDREKPVFIRVLTDFLIKRVLLPDDTLDTYIRIYCNLRTSLIEFFGINLPNKLPMQ